MGLLLGASVLTVFELLDLVIFNVMKKLRKTPNSKNNNENNPDVKLALTGNDVIEPGSARHSPSMLEIPGTAQTSAASSRKNQGVGITENPMNGVMDYGFGNNYSTPYKD